MIMTVPTAWCCKECSKREVGCHSTCPEYLGQREDHLKRKGEADKERHANEQVKSQHYEKAAKYAKRIKRSRRVR